MKLLDSSMCYKWKTPKLNTFERNFTVSSTSRRKTNEERGNVQVTIVSFDACITKWSSEVLPPSLEKHHDLVQILVSQKNQDLMFTPSKSYPTVSVSNLDHWRKSNHFWRIMVFFRNRGSTTNWELYSTS